MTAEERATELLPCICSSDMHALDNPCPHYYRPAVAAALAEARIEGLRKIRGGIEQYQPTVLLDPILAYIDAEIVKLSRPTHVSYAIAAVEVAAAPTSGDSRGQRERGKNNA